MERDEVVMIVARNIEAAMARKGTNPSEVARRAEVNHTAVYDILKGKSKHPRLDTIHKIAVKGLGIPMMALFVEPSDDELDQELAETIGLIPAVERRKILTIAKAFLPPDEDL
jgi:DNA-binding phage protein